MLQGIVHPKIKILSLFKLYKNVTFGPQTVKNACILWKNIVLVVFRICETFQINMVILLLKTFTISLK